MPVALPPADLIGSRSRQDQDLLLKRLRKEFAADAEYEHPYRLAAVDDLHFIAGEHWTPAEQQSRASMGRPCLTVNTLPQYERQITNESRQHYPSIRVLPVGNGADVQTAKICQGLTRHIEQSSHAEVAYHGALEAAVRHGRGYFRLCLDYEDEMSFDQVITIHRIRNPFMVYHDHSAQLPTYADSRHCFLFEHRDKEAFKEEWGVDASAMELWASTGDSWIFSDQVRIAEYFWRDEQRATLCQLADGTTGLLEPTLLAPWEAMGQPPALQRFVAHLTTPRPRYCPLLQWIKDQACTVDSWLADVPSEQVAMYRSQLFDLVGQLRQVRPTILTTIRWIKTNGHVILEESVWPGKWIPVIPVLGNELDINNRVMYSGIVRHAKDPMRMEDYWVTMQAEHVALSPVAPWIIAEGQLQGHESLWAQANKKPVAFLPYTVVMAHNGTPLPPPMRNSFEAPIQSITGALQTTQNYTEKAVGMYRESLGGRSNAVSGVAITRKDQQADQGALHYADNLARAVEFCGEQVVDLLPKVLTPGRIQRILGDDGSPQMVHVIDSRQEKPEQREQRERTPLPDGVAGVFDVGVGKYDVIASTGPSYATKREAAADQLIQLTDKMPDVMKVGIDLIVGSLDIDYAEEIAARLKKTIPPELLDEPGSDPKQQLAKAQGMLQKLSQEAQALNAHAQQVEQQAQQLAQEKAQLELRLAAKQDDALLRQHELAETRAMDAAKIALEEQKLAWEREQFYAERGQAVDVQAKVSELEAMIAELMATMAPAGGEG